MKNENIYIYENFKELLSLIAYLITNQINHLLCFAKLSKIWRKSNLYAQLKMYK